MYETPDIAHAVSVVSHYMDNPRKAYWQVVKWILIYLKGSTDMGLVFGRGINEVHNHVTRFCDSDYVVDLDRRRSLIDYVFTLGGSVISLCAKLYNLPLPYQLQKQRIWQL